MKIVNEPPKLLTLEGSAVETILNEAGEVSSVRFEGYSGDAVDLSDYGFDAPVVYDLSGMEVPQTVPLMYKHYEEIGHTTEVNNDGSKLEGSGTLSIPNTKSKEVGSGMKNKFPYQASMGLQVRDRRKIDYTSKGEVRVNNRVFAAPLYVVRNSKLREMSVTPFGRDGNTSFKFVNEEQLMEIKNSENGGTAVVDPPTTPTTPASDPTPVNNEQTPTTPPAPVAPTTPSTPAPAPINNANPTTPVAPDLSLILAATRLCNSYPTYVDKIEQGFKNGMTAEQVENSIKLDMFENGFVAPTRQKKQGDKNKAMFEARVMLSYGIEPEVVENSYGKEVAEKAYSLPEMTVVEQILYAANAAGGDFTGHSDVENMCEYYRNSGFSGIDLPNLLRRVSETKLEERWKINPPFATVHCKDESNKDFRKTERRRITGGGLWGEVNEDGKLPHYKPGKDTFYTSELTTVGSVFTMTRAEVINDDQGALRDLMDQMIESGMLVPDIQLGKLMFELPANSTFWIDDVNSFDSTAMTATNLKTLYNTARQYNESRSTLNWNTLIADQWKLIHSVEYEDDVFELIKQDRIVSNTTANTIQGAKNFLYNKFSTYIYPQMSNTSAFTGKFVRTGTYFLWPMKAMFAPFSINYLRGRKRPVYQSIDLPGDMLGRGIRGYWDVKVNFREPLTIIRASDVA